MKVRNLVIGALLLCAPVSLLAFSADSKADNTQATHVASDVANHADMNLQDGAASEWRGGGGGRGGRGGGGRGGRGGWGRGGWGGGWGGGGWGGYGGWGGGWGGWGGYGYGGLGWGYGGWPYYSSLYYPYFGLGLGWY